MESNIETKDCVRQLDSDLSLKCSKSDLLAHKVEVDQKFISIDNFKKCNDQIKVTEQKILLLRKNVEK